MSLKTRGLVSQLVWHYIKAVCVKYRPKYQVMLHSNWYIYSCPYFDRVQSNLWWEFRVPDQSARACLGSIRSVRWWLHRWWVHWTVHYSLWLHADRFVDTCNSFAVKQRTEIFTSRWINFFLFWISYFHDLFIIKVTFLCILLQRYVSFWIMRSNLSRLQTYSIVFQYRGDNSKLHPVYPCGHHKQKRWWGKHVSLSS